MTPPKAAGRSARAAIAGLVAALVALGVGELVAAVLRSQASPLLSTGSLVIDLAPPWAKETVIGLFGTGDKVFLAVLLVLVVAALAALAGTLEARRPPAGSVLVAVQAVVAAIAALTRTGATPYDVTPAVVTALTGIAVLRPLVARARRADAVPQTAAAGRTHPDRRAFLRLATIAGGAGALAAAGAAIVGQATRSVASAAARIRLPAAASTAAAPQAADSFAVQGLTPLVTPNADFYRIDIALSLPALDTADWALTVDGMVDHPLRLSYRELLRLPLEEHWTTLSCVSNEVGGDLIGSAKWLGYPLRALLERAGVQSDADMVLSAAADGFTAGTPLAALTADPAAMLAVGMNGVVLPNEHGFPVRMVVPGLYGYVSATKWLTGLTVTRFDRANGYWIDRGWSAKGPIKLSSRIDVPNGSASVARGVVAVAGVAWAPHTGIRRVQVQVDDEPWRDATLAGVLSIDTWRQWRYRWTATPGAHVLRVRATDANGLVQTAKVAAPAPNGATGLHSIQVTVT